MAISTNQKPTIYRNLYENTGRDYCNALYRIANNFLYKVVSITLHRNTVHHHCIALYSKAMKYSIVFLDDVTFSDIAP